MRKQMIVALLVMLAFLALAGAASADGIIIPIPMPPRPPEPIKSLAIKYHHVTVTIEDQVATTHVDQVFLNELPYDVEGDYIFPLPEQASISRFTMWVDGQPLEAQVLERDEAARIYEQIVRERRNPALLEYVGRNAFRARIYPIPGRGEKRIEIEYTQVLARDGDLVSYVYPLNTEKFSTRPLEDVSVSVTIASRDGITTVYSPSHEISVTRESDTRATVEYHERNVTPRDDFALYYAVSDDAVGVNVLSYRETGGDGYFVLLMAPRVDAEPEQVVARDVYLVLDVSGSMRGEKLAQAKDAARYVLDNLNSQDRFNIIAFSTATKAFADTAQPPSDKDKGVAFVGDLQAGGGTNIDGAFRQALQGQDKGRPRVIVFLTDGLATVGETNTEKILGNVEGLATEQVRIFSFGVGYDVNTTLLDDVSQGHHGTSSYVRPSEDLEAAVSSFYEKIVSPVVTDLSVQIAGADVSDAYPDVLPDLFAGGQVVLVGRYGHAGNTTVTLTGSVGGRAQRWTYPDVALRSQGGAEFIPRLWATRKIGYLLTQVRLHGAERELVDEIVALSVRYGIVTPYTSFLIDETEDSLSPEGRTAIVDRAYQQKAPGEVSAAPLMGLGGGASAATSGKASVEQSIGQNLLREADVAAGAPQDVVRIVGSKAFVLRDGVWTDTLYDASQPADRILMGSERYYQLLARYPELGRYLSLGQRVVVVWLGRAYQVDPDQGQAAAALEEVTATPTPQGKATPQPHDSLWKIITEWIGTR